MLLVSSSKPCEGFRVWIHHELTTTEASERATSAALLKDMAEQTAVTMRSGEPDRSSGQDADEDTSSASDEAMARHVDVTSLVAQLPPLHPSARVAVRNWSHIEEVIQGKDYATASSWILHLPPELLRHASGITVWIGMNHPLRW